MACFLLLLFLHNTEITCLALKASQIYFQLDLYEMNAPFPKLAYRCVLGDVRVEDNSG